MTVLWPMPGTTRSLPCGKRATTDAAPSVGVRMSKPPLIASIGTSGSGPAPSAAPPAGLGQSRQKSALPKRAAQVPNGPNEPGGSAAIAACSSAGRSATGVSGAQGNGPSWQTVAAYSASLSSIDGSSAAAVLQVGEPEQRLGVADARGLDDRGQLGCEAGAQVGAEDRSRAGRRRRRVTVFVRPFALGHLADERLRAELVRDRDDVAGEVARRAAAAAVGAERM